MGSTIAFVCPDCKSPLTSLRCSQCDYQYAQKCGFPVLLSRESKFAKATEFGEAYDAIYDDRKNVWEEQGRTPEFLKYFSSLMKELSNGKYLEIGSGEGFLLERVEAAEKHAIDLSTRALTSAQKRVRAQFSVALAERLPYPSETFDIVGAVGVMEHFFDSEEAIAEIRRVLKPGGHLVNLVHVRLTGPERVAWKISEYWIPRPRPLAFVQWMSSYFKPGIPKDWPKQPIQNQYTTAAGSRLISDTGFEICETITSRKDPALPLAGPDVVIYVARK